MAVQPIQHRLCRRQQMQAPDAAVGRVGPAFQQAAALEPVSQACHGNRLDLQQLGQFFLRKAGLPVEADQHHPLGARHAVRPGAAVSLGAQHTADIVQQD